ncbi:patatin-like phospholipase family protein [Flavobacteriaceae bacterium]|nr:patatin-like phospholipase family protein [Flavobacteriaceae bacterium]
MNISINFSYSFPRHICLTVFLFLGIAKGYAQGAENMKTEVFEHIKLPAQEQELKVGLVLSGGGAKGLAHIGALKVIEDSGVQIDYIAGTSMGAIVGALYASGYRANELDSIFRQINFNSLIQDDFSRSSKTFYEKEDAERYAISLPFDGYKISFPQAISGGQKVYNELVSLLYHVKDVRDFNQLPIPFFCMATDIENGTAIRLDNGYLPEAIMASGTFPSLFEPMELDGKLLIDGGVLNNYPIAELKSLGANFIVGVDVQHDLSSRASLGSATDILLQINNFRTAEAMKSKSNDTDIYIRPNMAPYSVIDFDRGVEIVAEGARAAFLKEKALIELSKKQLKRKLKDQTPLWNTYRKDTLNITYIEVNGMVNYSDDYVKGKLRFKEGDQIKFEDLKRGINNLAATNNFNTIRYKLIEKTTGLGLILNLKESDNKTNIRFGAHYDKLYKSAALVNITQKNFLRKDDVLSLDFIFGDYLRYQIDYYVDKGFNWSFGLRSNLNDFNFDIPYKVFEKNFRLPDDPNLNTVNMDFTDFTNQFYLQTVYKNAFSISLGLEHKWIKYSSDTFLQESTQTNNSSVLTLEKSHYASVYGQLRFDTLDDFFFPSKGFYLETDFQTYFLSSDFNGTFNPFSIFRSKAIAALNFTKNWSFVLAPEVGIKSGSSGTKSLDFALGGLGAPQTNNFIPFLGYDFIAIPGDSFLKMKATLDFEITPKNHFIVAANIAKVTDDILRPGSFKRAPSYFGYGLGYGFESIIGPMQMMYTKSPLNGNGSVFFSLGFPF